MESYNTKAAASVQNHADAMQVDNGTATTPPSVNTQPECERQLAAEHGPDVHEGNGAQPDFTELTIAMENAAMQVQVEIRSQPANETPDVHASEWLGEAEGGQAGIEAEGAVSYPPGVTFGAAVVGQLSDEGNGSKLFGCEFRFFNYACLTIHDLQARVRHHVGIPERRGARSRLIQRRGTTRRKRIMKARIMMTMMVVVVMTMMMTRMEVASQELVVVLVVVMMIKMTNCRTHTQVLQTRMEVASQVHAK